MNELETLKRKTAASLNVSLNLRDEGVRLCSFPSALGTNESIFAAMSAAMDSAYKLGQADPPIRYELGPSPRDIVLAEYTYWRDAEAKNDSTPTGSSDSALIHMGAMVAASNILAAMMGHPASWHMPKQIVLDPTPEQREKLMRAFQMESTSGTRVPGEVFRKVGAVTDSPLPP